MPVMKTPCELYRVWVWVCSEEKLIDTITTSNFYLKFEENNENEMAAHAFWAVFLLHPMAEPNRPNS